MSRVATRKFFRHGLLPQLLVFEAVARLGSVTRAAEELHLAQPTVSLQLRKLAETLGVVLFEPDGRRLRLTGAGRALQERCGELIEWVSLTDARLEPWRQPRTERLQLAAEPGARSVASRLLADFCGRYPGVKASLHIAERGELVERFSAGKDDVYIFELDVEGLPAEQRWSVAHAKGRDIARVAALFVREALSGSRPASPAAAAPPGHRGRAIPD
jgi:LysR family transcriptional regulator, low CO2-responsive transcriptional regulator